MAHVKLQLSTVNQEVVSQGHVKLLRYGKLDRKTHRLSSHHMSHDSELNFRLRKAGHSHLTQHLVLAMSGIAIS